MVSDLGRFHAGQLPVGTYDASSSAMTLVGRLTMLRMDGVLTFNQHAFSPQRCVAGGRLQHRHVLARYPKCVRGWRHASRVHACLPRGCHTIDAIRATRATTSLLGYPHGDCLPDCPAQAINDAAKATVARHYCAVCMSVDEWDSRRE